MEGFPELAVYASSGRVRSRQGANIQRRRFFCWWDDGNFGALLESAGSRDEHNGGPKT